VPIQQFRGVLFLFAWIGWLFAVARTLAIHGRLLLVRYWKCRGTRDHLDLPLGSFWLIGSLVGFHCVSAIAAFGYISRDGLDLSVVVRRCCCRDEKGENCVDRGHIVKMSGDYGELSTLSMIS
jgi:hypothetical protein